MSQYLWRATALVFVIAAFAVSAGYCYDVGRPGVGWACGAMAGLLTFAAPVFFADTL